MTPVFVDDIFIYSSDHRILYLNPEVPDWITINEKYKSVLDLVDGKNDETVVYEHISRFYGNEKDVLLPQVKSLFATSQIFKHNQTKSDCITGAVANKLKHVYLTLTDSCNLKCVYCYATEREKCDNSTYETWSKFVQDIIDSFGKITFTFTGGEPLLVPYMFDLAEFIKRKGGDCILLTNGTQIDTEEKAERVASLFRMVKISLDTSDENISKDLRGYGVVTKVQNAFDVLSAKRCNVQILATATAKTCNNLDSFSSEFNGQVNFQPLYRMGRARNNEDISITGLQYYNALTASGRFNLLHSYHNNISGYRNNPYKRCAMAIEELSIDAMGNVFPCHLLHFDRLNCGNLNNKSIADIYNNSAVLKELRAINVDSIPKCKVCVYRNFCGGACRARVDIAKLGIKGYDPFCEFERKTILDALLYSYG